MADDIISLTQVYEEHYIHMILQVMAATFLYYDHIITIGQEIRYIWSHPKTRSSFLFFFLRYFGFASNLTVIILSAYPLSNDGCRRYSLYRQVLLVVTQTIVCVFLTIRIYALFNCDNRILIFLCVSAVILLGTSVYILIGQKSVRYPIDLGCHFGIGTSRKTAIRLAGVWEALFVYDSILFILTVFRTYRYWLRKRYAHGSRQTSLLSLMFRDGAMYFGIMALATLANILTFYLCGPFMRGGLSSFTSCMSVVMMCRLMLNLHATANTGLDTKPSDPRRADLEDYSDSTLGSSGSPSMLFETILDDSFPMDTYHTTATTTGAESRQNVEIGPSG